MLVSVRTLFAAILMLLIRIAVSDVVVTEPQADAQFSGSGGTVSIDLKWEDNGAIPQVDQAIWFAFTLMTGPNDQIEFVKTLVPKITLSQITKTDNTYSYTLQFPSASVGNGQYYIQVYAQLQGGHTNNYSPRFQLTSMGGTSSATFSDSTQPPGETDVAGTGTTTASVDTRSFTLYYTQQTGISRFAPMQMQPGTKITATTWTRKFPATAVTYYSTYRSSLAQETTITPGWSYKLSSGINFAAPAPYPTDNGGWQNPQQRQSLSTRKINLRKRASPVGL
ncbi:hypothetical protein HG537_0A01970 [Torulaspora globosa]|uniref:Yeast cell wall synthesis Kre9/Knh1 C-terminal domain-containing protein n=1 Tax=Torulaspora globosa TaxID=48254 RepID=A0A7H9HKM5_9SACH|nr:hypothetical protein HG537_0A01970 [Torulaspora sp. CBS 2947]